MNLLSVLFAVMCLVFLIAAPPAWAQESRRTKPSPREVLRILEEGNRRFAAGKPRHPHPSVHAARLAQAGSEDQADHAIATVLGCSDSRVPVELLFDQGVMDLFVVRVAGNVVNTDEAGSIEYGLAHVRTPVLVVLGHTQCGAVTSVARALQGESEALERNIPPLVESIEPAVREVLATQPGLEGEALVNAAVEQNVWQGIERLFLMSPATRALVAAGEALVTGAIYDVGSGHVRWLPLDQVEEILERVGTDAKRAREPMAR